VVLEYEGLVKRFGAITALDGVSFTAVQLRRTMLPSLVALGLLLDIGVPLVLLDVAPTFAWAWTAVVLVGAVAGAGGQLAVELEHYHLRLAPLRPLPALLWLSAIPAVHRVVSTELAWLPVLFAPRVTTGIWATGVVLIPCLILLAEATGSAAVVATDGWHTRIGLKLAFAALGVLPAAAVGSRRWRSAGLRRSSRRSSQRRCSCPPRCTSTAPPIASGRPGHPSCFQ